MRTGHGAATAANGGDRNGGAETRIPATDDIPAEATPYQLLPPLSADEYAALAASIAANGDRRDMSKGAKAMLAALMPGSTVFLGNTQGVAQGMVSKARQVIEFCDEASITADPDLSDREHARRCGCSPTTDAPSTASPDLIARRFEDVLALAPGLAAGAR